MSEFTSSPSSFGSSGSVPAGEAVETERLRLSKVSAADVEWIWALDQDPEVMRHLTGGVPTSRGVLEAQYLPRMLQRHEGGAQYGFYRAEAKAGGPPIGWFHLRPERLEPFDMELGYRLRRDVWGRGFATEGSRELLRLAVGPWGLPRVAARTLVGNGASRRVMEKCGMRLERSFSYPAEWLPGFTDEERRAVRYVIEAAPAASG